MDSLYKLLESDYKSDADSSSEADRGMFIAQIGELIDNLGARVGNLSNPANPPLQGDPVALPQDSAGDNNMAVAEAATLEVVGGVN